VSSACEPNVPNTPSGPTATSATQIFSGTVAPGETPSTTFTIPAAQVLRATLTSLTSPTGQPLGTQVTLRFGIPNTAGTACNSVFSVATTARLTSQISSIVNSGVYCIGLVDTAGLAVTANYAIRVVYGTPAEGTIAGTIPYGSTVFPGGYTARSFSATTDGTVTVFMESISPAGIGPLGVGIGITKSDGSGCNAAAVANLSTNGTFSLAVDPGKYCVKVFDPGTLANTATFQIRITHP